MKIVQIQKYLYDRGQTELNHFVLIENDQGVAKIGNWGYTGIPIPKEQDLPTEQDAEAWAVEYRNSQKSYMLKVLENLYIDLLTNKWTPVLRAYNIIAPTYAITVENTDSNTNIYYLIQLRQLNFDEYSKMAGEFQRLRDEIENAGGIMAEVRYHNL